MILKESSDPFGGRLTIVNVDSFTCQVETAGKEMGLMPSTFVFDLSPPVGTHFLRRAIRLTHGTTSFAGQLLIHHKIVVGFLDDNARLIKGTAFADVMKAASSQLDDLGEWDWLPPRESEIASEELWHGSPGTVEDLRQSPPRAIIPFWVASFTNSLRQPDSRLSQ